MRHDVAVPATNRVALNSDQLPFRATTMHVSLAHPLAHMLLACRAEPNGQR
ncbi:MAG: hypothetical protein QM770_16700 [Tepidisphaeraceae bacterium]